MWRAISANIKVSLKKKVQIEFSTTGGVIKNYNAMLKKKKREKSSLVMY